MIHTLDPQLLERPIRILVVGCGGNGSAIASGLPYLHQAMLAFGHPGGLQVTLTDPDTVSETNCVRQPFCRTEIGFPKAIVLAHRINLFWGLNWQGMQAQVHQIAKNADVDLVIGCVDTRKARRAIDKVGDCIHRCSTGSTLVTTLQADNSSSASPRIRSKQKREVPSARLSVNFSRRLPGTGAKEDDQPSCSAVEALNRQNPSSTRISAYQALGMLTQLLRYGSFSTTADSTTYRLAQVVPLHIREGTTAVLLEPPGRHRTFLRCPHGLSNPSRPGTPSAAS